MLDKLLSTEWYVMTHGTLSPLFQMICQFPKPCVCSLLIGADAFDSESLAVRNTVDAMFRMTTPLGQVLMGICRFVLYVS
jgi:hypothetical protein